MELCMEGEEHARAAEVQHATVCRRCSLLSSGFLKQLIKLACSLRHGSDKDLNVLGAWLRQKFPGSDLFRYAETYELYRSWDMDVPSS